MVQAVGYLVFGTAASLSVGGVALTTAAGTLTIAGTLANLAITTAITAALFRQEAPEQAKPSNQRQGSKVSTADRIMHVGRVRVSGNVVFHRAEQGVSYRVVVHGHGEIHQVLQYYMFDQPVTLAPEDFSVDVHDPNPTLPPGITSADFDRPFPLRGGSGRPPIDYETGHVLHWDYAEGRPRVKVLTRLGAVPAVHWQEITDIWPEWTSDHRLDGQWQSLIIAESVGPEKQLRIFPNGEPKAILDAETAIVFDPRDGQDRYSDNAALLINHLVSHPDGFNRPGAIDPEDVKAEADFADLPAALAGGGSEPMFRLSGSWSLREKPQDVLRRFLGSCGARMRLKPNGLFGLRLGRWVAPTVTIGFEDIVEVRELDSGPDMLERFNTLPASYVDRDLGMQEVDAEDWVDQARLAVDGETLEAQRVSFPMSPSHRQTRACMKLATERANPGCTLVLLCKPRALPAKYEDVVTLNAPQIGLVGSYEVKSHNMLLGEGHFSGLVLGLREVDAAAYSLDLSEQGQVQTLPADTTDTGVPQPQNVVATGGGIEVASGTYAAGIVVTSDALPSAALVLVARYKRSDGTGSWQTVTGASGDTRLDLVPLVDGADYDIEVWAETAGGAQSDDITFDDVTAVAVATAPASATGLTVTDQTGGVALVQFTTSTDAALWTTEILRDGQVVGFDRWAPGIAVSWQDVCGAGSFNWEIRSVNVSQVENAANAGPVTQTIT